MNPVNKNYLLQRFRNSPSDPLMDAGNWFYVALPHGLIQWVSCTVLVENNHRLTVDGFPGVSAQSAELKIYGANHFNPSPSIVAPWTLEAKLLHTLVQPSQSGNEVYSVVFETCFRYIFVLCSAVNGTDQPGNGSGCDVLLAVTSHR